MADVDIYRRFFVFSQTQMNTIKANEKKLGHVYSPGTVIVNGTSKSFTDILFDMSKSKFSDSIIVTTGDIRKIKYNDAIIE